VKPKKHKEKKMLELKIEALTKAIEKLIFTIESQNSTGQKAHDAKQEEVKSDVASEKVTYDDLQTFCLTLVRKNRDNKDKIKGVLQAHGANLIKDLKPSALSQVKADLESL
jgi:hypothetical protein